MRHIVCLTMKAAGVNCGYASCDPTHTALNVNDRFLNEWSAITNAIIYEITHALTDMINGDNIAISKIITSEKSVFIYLICIYIRV